MQGDGGWADWPDGLIILASLGAVVQLHGAVWSLPPCPRPSLHFATLGDMIQTFLVPSLQPCPPALTGTLLLLSPHTFLQPFISLLSILPLCQSLKELI